MHDKLYENVTGITRPLIAMYLLDAGVDINE